MRIRTLAWALLAFGAVTVAAADAQGIEGDWHGTIATPVAELRVVVHLIRDGDGELSGTLDSLDQGVRGIPLESVSLVESTLAFTVPQTGGAYEGSLDESARSITGSWRQAGLTFPLSLTRAPAEPAAILRVPSPSDIDGDWEGTLTTPAATLTVVLHITTYEDGMSATLDAPAQKSFGAPVTSIERDGRNLQFEMRQFASDYTGTLNAELTAITGTWVQFGNTLPLILRRVTR